MKVLSILSIILPLMAVTTTSADESESLPSQSINWSNGEDIIDDGKVNNEDDPQHQLEEEYVSKVRDWVVSRKDDGEPYIGLTRKEKARQRGILNQQQSATTQPTSRQGRGGRRKPENPQFLPEWSEMQGVLIRYPLGIPTYLVKAMSKRAKIFCLVAEYDRKRAKKTLHRAGIQDSDIEWIIAPTDTYWTRDYGPWFVSTPSSSKGIAIVDHEYDVYERHLDNMVPKKIAKALDVPYYNSKVIGAGGNIMVDGTGQAVATHVAYTEDPACDTFDETSVPLKKCRFVDKRMRDYFGVGVFQVIADPTGNFIDHVDCWAKYLSPTTILIREVSKYHPRRKDIEKVVRYFERTQTFEGQPWTIVRVWTDSNQPYTNSLILNKEVFVPLVGSRYDEDALEVYREAMPGYEVSGWYGRWDSEDALHCRTIGIPQFGTSAPSTEGMDQGEYLDSTGNEQQPQQSYGDYQQDLQGGDQEEEQRSIPSQAIVAPPPSRWKSATTSDGDVYYYNEKTNKTQWKKPYGF